MKYQSVKYRISGLYVISLIKLLNHSKSLGKSHLSASGCHAGCDATSREITLTQCDRTFVFISKSRLVRARRRHHLDIPGPPPHIRFVCTYFDTTMWMKIVSNWLVSISVSDCDMDCDYNFSISIGSWIGSVYILGEKMIVTERTTTNRHYCLACKL